MPCSFEHEHRLRRQGIFPVAGVDEAGRGPLAGPVVAAAVILPERIRLPGLDDSKKLTPRQREEFHLRLTENPAVVWAVSVREADVVDRINILRACHEAMAEAVRMLSTPAAHALIDGLPVRNFVVAQTALVGGDGLSRSIAAASVIAKVTRDRIMQSHAGTWPVYGFDRHKGYATREHLASLGRHGPCPIHRRSFSPVAQMALGLF
jgi:ribonuclease HII